jgi:hypothetical protein
MNKLKIGLLLDGVHTDNYVLDLLTWANTQDDLEIAAAIVCPPDAATAAGTGPGFAATLQAAHRLASRLSFAAVIAVERQLLRFFKPHRGHLAVFDLRQASAYGALARLQAQCGAQGYELGTDEAVRLSGLKLDLLVQFGSKALGTSLRDGTRLGTITLDYHGRRANRATPPGFWEAYARAPKTEFEISHLAPGRGGARLLVNGSFPTKFLFLLNQAHLYRKAGAQIKRLLKDMAVTRCTPSPELSPPYSGRYFVQPGWHQSSVYLAKIAGRLLAKAFYRIFNIREKWGISCIYSDWKHAALWNSTRIAAPRGHFWADPFLCAHDGKTYCFVEDYVYKTGRGHISVLEITDKGAVYLGDCIRENFHMSFPFLFRYQGELFMCPEASQSRQVRVYRCTSFPLGWELCAVPMAGVSAADSMLFEHQGKWWMLTNIDRSGLNDHCSELCLFSASSPLAQDWVPHPHNPLRIDADGGRNAGLILDDNRIFRAAQRQGFDQYGKGLRLYEIVTLNDAAYEERALSDIDCNFRSGLLGSHHMSTTGSITVFDHVGRCFCP